MINNRQAGRRRGRGGQQQRPQGNSGRQDTGNRIDNRSRGNAAQLLEKYKALARDAQMAGDRVNTEYYLQFADHYFRVLAETRSRFEENRTPAPGGANTFQDDEQDYDDEGEPVARADPPRQNEGARQDGNRQDGSRQDGNRQDGRQNGQQNAGQPYQGERQSEGNRGNQNSDRQDRQPAERAQHDEERPRRQNGFAQGGAANGNVNAGANDQAADRYVRDDRGSRAGRVLERSVEEDRQDAAPAAALPPAADQPQQDAPRRRGRPRREVMADAPPSDPPAAFEADRLPPSLNISAVTPAADTPGSDVAGTEADEKPRRRRGRPPASGVTPA